jgi:uncharacterized protein involved in exopolysaccharide biosynthesis/Mrp family chromosome partitioning ATPase
MENNNQTTTSSPGFSLGDIYYVLFRRKWIVLFFLALGVGAGLMLKSRIKAPYQSEAKLLVRYVQDQKSLSIANDSTIKSPDSRGEGILNAEAEILQSLDVANSVVDAIGAERIVGKAAGTTNRDLAASVIRNGIVVGTTKRGNVMTVGFKHANREMVQPILRQILDSYFKKHVEVHKATGVYQEFLLQETDRIRSQLQTTESELRKVKGEADVITLEESKKAFSDQRSRLRQEMNDARVELAERKAMLAELQRNAAAGVAAAAGTNSVANTNVVAGAGTIPGDVLLEYSHLSERLSVLWGREKDLLQNFKEGFSLVKEVRAQIEDLKAQQSKMLADYPALANKRFGAESATNPTGMERAGVDPVGAEMARVTAIEAKIGELQAQSDRLKAEITSLENVELKIADLQRKKDKEESQYKYYSTSLDQNRIDEVLGSGKLANINEFQAPTPPFQDMMTVIKKVGAVSGGIIAIGLLLPFLMELVFIQTVRRPDEVVNVLKLPLFLTIPEMGRGVFGRRKKTKAAGAAKKAEEFAGEAANGEMAVARRNGNGNGELAVWDEKHEMHPYSEALRDRLVSFFETRNMTHKPKLIAVTACDTGAGVTSVAAGLAASLSETGEGNVLLVDMNLEQGAAHPFYKGKPTCGLEELLTQSKRDVAQVGDKLFMVTGGQTDATDSRLPRILPKRFTHLLPKLHASDYDYIIFDMPPVTQTTITQRLAGLMDIMLLVVESEKTNRGLLKHVRSTLAEGKANLGVVYNRRRNYVPRWLHQEIF